jgi:hypothetical protein
VKDARYSSNYSYHQDPRKNRKTDWKHTCLLLPSNGQSLFYLWPQQSRRETALLALRRLHSALCYPCLSCKDRPPSEHLNLLGFAVCRVHQSDVEFVSGFLQPVFRKNRNVNIQVEADSHLASHPWHTDKNRFPEQP